MAEKSIAYRDPHALVQTDWLAAHLNDPNLRIFDCTTHLRPPQEGSKAAYEIVSGRADYDAAHIPGAAFLDLQGELSDKSVKLRFMLPRAEDFAAAMSRHGVGDRSRVIVYCAGGMMWATRVWWMLSEFGFTNAAVLDGGWEKWNAEGRPVSSEPCRYSPAVFTPRPAVGMFVNKDRVRAAIGDSHTVTVNALPAELHSGKGPGPYGRPGRIPGSVNVPYSALIDRQTRALVPPAEAAAKFAAAGVDESKNVICYCGVRNRREPGLVRPPSIGLPQPQPVRRLNERVGTGRIPADRNRLSRSLVLIKTTSTTSPPLAQLRLSFPRVAAPHEESLTSSACPT